MERGVSRSTRWATAIGVTYLFLHLKIKTLRMTRSPKILWNCLRLRSPLRAQALLRKGAPTRRAHSPSLLMISPGHQLLWKTSTMHDSALAAMLSMSPVVQIEKYFDSFHSFRTVYHEPCLAGGSCPVRRLPTCKRISTAMIPCSLRNPPPATQVCRSFARMLRTKDES